MKNKFPIEQFKDQKELNTYLKYWQNILGLNDWVIKAKFATKEECDLECSSAEIHYKPMNKYAQILIRSGFEDDISVFRHCQELDLVHELMHCKIELMEYSDNIEGKSYELKQHQLVDDMAKSLLMAKYDIDLSWFEIEEEN